MTMVFYFLQKGQEEWLQRVCPLLSKANPGVQGGIRYHGRWQGRSPVVLRHRCCLQLRRQVHLWRRGPRHALRGSWTSQLHTDGHAFRREDGRRYVTCQLIWNNRLRDDSWNVALLTTRSFCLQVPTMTTPSPRLSMPSKSTAKLTQKCKPDDKTMTSFDKF